MLANPLFVANVIVIALGRRQLRDGLELRARELVQLGEDLLETVVDERLLFCSVRVAVDEGAPSLLRHARQKPRRDLCSMAHEIGVEEVFPTKQELAGRVNCWVLVGGRR